MAVELVSAAAFGEVLNYYHGRAVFVVQCVHD